MEKIMHVFLGIVKKIIIGMLLFFVSCKYEGTSHPKRLQNASSPYLREHADNPVNWFEWGNEAFEKAKKEDKPLLISIGYSSCHWCHVMEKESFMDTAVARIMNENFICINVDREERPDIDNIYTNALQLLSGNSGWPLNAFALPNGKAFFAGTYYSTKSWSNLLLEIAKAYKEKHNLVVKQAEAISAGMAEQNIIKADSSDKPIKNLQSLYAGLYDSIYKKTDLLNGGLKGKIKFPTPAFAEFLLQHYYATGNIDALNAADITLKKMALGGIYDQLEGGFARYTIDASWHVPHFEKMLYDNGQLVSLYAHAYQVTKNEFYKKILTETIAFVEKNLTAQSGGYYSSLNADSESEEGKFYTWSEADFSKAIGGDEILTEYFHVATPGNWGETNILYADKTPAEFAKEKNLQPAEFTVKLEAAEKMLLKERNKRIKPTVDTKIITAWNSIMLKGYVDAYSAIGDAAYLEKAKKLAGFIEKNLLSANGGLQRNLVDGKATILGFLDDYAWTAAAFIRLYEVSFDTHWMTLAKKIIDYAITNFNDDKSGLLFYSQTQMLSGMAKKVEIADDYLPSSNAIMAKVFYTIGTVYDDTTYTNRSLKMLSTVTTRVQKMPSYHIQWGIFAGLVSGKSYEIMVVGKNASTMKNEIAQRYLPTSILMGSDDNEDLPLLKGKLIKDKTLIYVCTDKMCKKPVEDVAKALEQIK